MRHRKDDWSGKYFKIFFFFSYSHAHKQFLFLFFSDFNDAANDRWFDANYRMHLLLVFNIIFFFFSVIVHFINEVKKNSRDLWKIIYVQTHAQWPIILGHSKHLSIVGFVAYFFLSLKTLFLFYLLDGNDWNMFFFISKLNKYIENVDIIFSNKRRSSIRNWIRSQWNCGCLWVWAKKNIYFFPRVSWMKYFG